MDGHLIGVRLAIDWQSFGIESVMDQHRLGIGLAALTTDWNEIGAKAVEIGSHTALYWIQIGTGLTLN